MRRVVRPGRADAGRRTGDLSGAAEAARRRIRLRPLEEAGYRTLMQHQADAGDRAGAVSTYHHCASVLERELGVLPDPGDEAGVPALADPRPGRRRATGRRARGRPFGFAVAQLVGRSGELGLLQRVWRAAAAGRAAVVVVRGDAGVGKTPWSARLHGWRSGRAPWWPAAGASGPRGGWRWHRWPTGCATRRSSRPRPRWTRSGGPKSNGWCRRRAERIGRRFEGHGRRLAAPPLLRGPGSGVACRRAPDAPGPGQYAVV